jgi:hypothetical protein
LLDGFRHKLRRENNAATLIRPSTGTFPTRRCVPAERSGAHHGFAAAPYVDLAFLAIPARAAPAAKQGKTQMQADQPGCTQMRTEPALAHVDPAGVQACHLRASRLIRVHLRCHFLLWTLADPAGRQAARIAPSGDDPARTQTVAQPALTRA